LLIEYDPQPAFDVGSPEKAAPELLQSALERLADGANAPELVQAMLDKRVGG